MLSYDQAIKDLADYSARIERLRAAIKNIIGMCEVQSPNIGNMHRVESIKKIATHALKD